MAAISSQPSTEDVRRVSSRVARLHRTPSWAAKATTGPYSCDGAAAVISDEDNDDDDDDDRATRQPPHPQHVGGALGTSLAESYHGRIVHFLQLAADVGLPGFDISYIHAHLVAPASVRCHDRLGEFIELLRESRAVRRQLQQLADARDVLCRSLLLHTACHSVRESFSPATREALTRIARSAGTGRSESPASTASSPPPTCDARSHERMSQAVRELDRNTIDILQTLDTWRVPMTRPQPFLMFPGGANIVTVLAQQYGMGEPLSQVCVHLRSTSRHLRFFYQSPFDAVTGSVLADAGGSSVSTATKLPLPQVVGGARPSSASTQRPHSRPGSATPSRGAGNQPPSRPTSAHAAGGVDDGNILPGAPVSSSAHNVSRPSSAARQQPPLGSRPSSAVSRCTTTTTSSDAGGGPSLGGGAAVTAAGALQLWRRIVLGEVAQQDAVLCEMLQLARMGYYLPVFKLTPRVPGVAPRTSRAAGQPPGVLEERAASRHHLFSIARPSWKRALVRRYAFTLLQLRLQRGGPKSATFKMSDLATFSTQALHVRYLRKWIEFVSLRRERRQQSDVLLAVTHHAHLRMRLGKWIGWESFMRAKAQIWRPMLHRTHLNLMRRYVHSWYLTRAVSRMARNVRRAVHLTRFRQWHYRAVCHRRRIGEWLRSVQGHSLAMVLVVNKESCPFLSAIMILDRALAPLRHMANTTEPVRRREVEHRQSIESTVTLESMKEFLRFMAKVEQAFRVSQSLVVTAMRGASGGHLA